MGLWALGLDDHDLIMGSEELNINITDCITPIIIPPGKIHETSIDYASSVRRMPLTVSGDGKLSAIIEPATDAAVCKELSQLNREMRPALQESTCRLIRNEMRYQCTPEAQAKQGYTLRLAHTKMPMDHGAFLSIPGATEAELLGDRQRTYEKVFADAGEILELWKPVCGAQPLLNGWVIPEHLQTVNGGKRQKRTTR